VLSQVPKKTAIAVNSGHFRQVVRKGIFRRRTAQDVRMSLETRGFGISASSLNLSSYRNYFRAHIRWLARAVSSPFRH
jgi:hypothetical protein